jgi:hypothetical protein
MFNAGKTRAGVAGLGLAVIVGFSSTVVGPAAADTTNQKSFMAAQAASARTNVASFDASTKPPIGKARFRATSPSGAAIRSDAAPKSGVVAASGAAQPQTFSVAARPVEQPKNGAAFVPADRGTLREASRPLEQLKASAAARPAATNEAMLRPVAIAAARDNVTLRPAAAAAPANAPARLAMLTPFSATTTAKSATRELLRSKTAVSALHKARHDAASHQR